MNQTQSKAEALAMTGRNTRALVTALRDIADAIREPVATLDAGREATEPPTQYKWSIRSLD